MVIVRIPTIYGILSVLIQLYMKILLPAALCVLCINCMDNHKPETSPPGNMPSIQTGVFYSEIGAIPSPGGYKRKEVADSSFAGWLRKLPLKKDKTVYLYNGQKKINQLSQYAVLEVSIGTQDLLQCADAVIRLRAEYLYGKKSCKPFSFYDFSGKEYRWKGNQNRQQFDNYLATVFGWCGSASLEKQMKPVPDIWQMQAGDVFVKGGFPGHAVIIVDMAENEKGEKIFMLAQGYMPAQDIHVLINPFDEETGPWYNLSTAEKIYTPEWTFSKEQLKTW